jgi:hypothetical protein
MFGDMQHYAQQISSASGRYYTAAYRLRSTYLIFAASATVCLLPRELPSYYGTNRQDSPGSAELLQLFVIVLDKAGRFTCNVTKDL